MYSKLLQCVVPWRNPEQFLQVFKDLFSNDIITMQRAVNEIAVWETRCFPSLPKEIEATVGLVRAIIHDVLYDVQATLYQDKEICMLYSSALIRFVNLVIEFEKNSSRPSMFEAAQKKHIPTWIIDVRHAVCHSVMPTLGVFRITATQALEYLRKSYWEKKVKNIKPLIKISTKVFEEQVLSLLQQYRTIQIKIINEGNSDDNLESRLSSILEKLHRSISSSSTEFLEILLKPGAFISIDDIKNIVQHEEPLFLESEELHCLPLVMERMWFPLLHLLHKNNLLPDFLEMLLLTKQELKACQKMTAAWGLRMLTATSLDTNANSPLERLFLSKNVLFDKHRLLYACVSNENVYCQKVLLRILIDIPDGHLVNDVVKLYAIYQGTGIQSKNSKQVRHEFVFTAEDLEEDFLFETNDIADSDDKSVWSKAPLSMDFSQVPLGGVMNPSVYQPVNEEGRVEENDEKECFIGNSAKELLVESAPFPTNQFRDEDIDFNQITFVYEKRAKILSL